MLDEHFKIKLGSFQKARIIELSDVRTAVDPIGRSAYDSLLRNGVPEKCVHRHTSFMVIAHGQLSAPFASPSVVE